MIASSVDLPLLPKASKLGICLAKNVNAANLEEVGMAEGIFKLIIHIISGGNGPKQKFQFVKISYVEFSKKVNDLLSRVAYTALLEC
jgi:hypothetical protein